MVNSVYADGFVGALNHKFPDKNFIVQAGRKFDRIVLVETVNTVHAFVDRETGYLIKAASWKTPQKNPDTKQLAIRFDLTTLEGIEEAVTAADVNGSYLYWGRVIRNA